MAALMRSTFDHLHLESRSPVDARVYSVDSAATLQKCYPLAITFWLSRTLGDQPPVGNSQLNEKYEKRELLLGWLSATMGALDEDLEVGIVCPEEFE